MPPFSAYRPRLTADTRSFSRPFLEIAKLVVVRLTTVQQRPKFRRQTTVVTPCRIRRRLPLPLA